MMSSHSTEDLVEKSHRLTNLEAFDTAEKLIDGEGICHDLPRVVVVSKPIDDGNERLSNRFCIHHINTCQKLSKDHRLLHPCSSDFTVMFPSTLMALSSDSVSLRSVCLGINSS